MKKLISIINTAVLTMFLSALIVSTAWAKDKDKKGEYVTPVIHHIVSVSTNPPGSQVYVNDKLVCLETPGQIELKVQGKIRPNKKYMRLAIEEAKRESTVKLTIMKPGYQPVVEELVPEITEVKVLQTKGPSIYQFDWPKLVNVNLIPVLGGVYGQDPTIMAGQAQERVSRDNAGKTELERTIIRWFFDSNPQGARIFYRVISSIPAEVKNTNETYLMTTPFEETRSFNILGLTYENSRDVQVEIKVVKDGYEPQIKRFNVRQAIDQQEISSFFDLVKKND